MDAVFKKMLLDILQKFVCLRQGFFPIIATTRHLRREFRARLKARKADRRKKAVNEGYAPRYDDLFYEGLGVLNVLGEKVDPEVSLGDISSAKPVKVEKEEDTFSLRVKPVPFGEVKLLAAPVKAEEGKEATLLSVKPDSEPANKPADRAPEHPGARLVLWVACDICKTKLPLKKAREQRWWIGPPPVRKKSRIRHKVAFRCPEHTPAIWLKERENQKAAPPQKMVTVTASMLGKLPISENNIREEGRGSLPAYIGLSKPLRLLSAIAEYASKSPT